jgi:hypothetical protein
MIKILIDLLQHDDFLNCGNTIEIAKGKNELPRNYSTLKTKIKRQWQTLKK